MFIDYAKIVIKSGDGGRGHISFRREKFVPKGGPDGGNGGRGADVAFYGNPHLNTLVDFRYRRLFKASDGNPGSYANRTGKSGKTLVIQVPLGTVVKDTHTGKVIADITEADKEVVVAIGGRGGRGNAEFVTSVNQAPRSADPGEPGVELELVLELKLLADVGLVGFPNAGKSTLISTISAARPKIADYPFTTLIPNLGIVSVAEEKSFTVADIPGLIEGAHEGKGLGIRFLRHVERTSVLVFLLDCTTGNPAEQYEILTRELQLFNPRLARKRRIICFTKTDALDDEQRQTVDDLCATFREERAGVKIFAISSVSGENIDSLKWAMWEELLQAREEEVPEDMDWHEDPVLEEEDGDDEENENEDDEEWIEDGEDDDSEGDDEDHDSEENDYTDDDSEEDKDEWIEEESDEDTNKNKK